MAGVILRQLSTLLPHRALLGGAFSFLAGCALVQSPSEQVDAMAEAAQFDRVVVVGSQLRTYLKSTSARAPELLTVFIESDGAPWPWPDTPPVDPTPVKPLVMRMAVADPSAHVAYVARPCQFLSPSGLAACDPTLWTEGRFRSDAVRAVEIAVDALKARSGAKKVNLVGFSGGGAMAALVAARRQDVGCLVTIAAPLDTSAWTDAIGVSRLSASLNPADAVTRLRGLPQTHFSGQDDTVVPSRSAGRLFSAIQASAWISVPGFDHDCCWERDWVALRRRSCLANAG